MRADRLVGGNRRAKRDTADARQPSRWHGSAPDQEQQFWCAAELPFRSTGPTRRPRTGRRGRSSCAVVGCVLVMVTTPRIIALTWRLAGHGLL